MDLKEYKDAVLAGIRKDVRCSDANWWKELEKAIEVLHGKDRSVDFATGYVIAGLSIVQFLENMSGASQGLAAFLSMQSQMN